MTILDLLVSRVRVWLRETIDLLCAQTASLCRGSSVRNLDQVQRIRLASKVH